MPLNSDQLALLQTLSPEEREVALAALGSDHTFQILKDQDWREIPVSPEEFFSNPYYCGKEVIWDPVKERGLYPLWKRELCYVLDPQNGVREFILSGSLGSGKSLVAALAFVYLLYKFQCLKNPHEYLGLMDNTPITFLVMNVTLNAAGDTGMGYIEDFINGSPYFRETFPENRRKKQKLKSSRLSNSKYAIEYSLELPPSFRIVEGSGTQHSIGRNVICTMLDEANFMQRSTKDGGRYQYSAENRAYQLYTGLRNRTESRYTSKNSAVGLMILISSAASASDFLEHHKKKYRNTPGVHISEFSRWEISPWKYSTETFRVFVGGRTASSRILEDGEPDPPANLGRVIYPPIEFKPSFERDVSLAIREHAGIPSDVLSPLIPIKEQIAMTEDHSRLHPFKEISPVIGHLSKDKLIDHLVPEELVTWYGGKLVPKYHRNMSRYIHVDIGVTSDRLGFAVGGAVGLVPGLISDANGNSVPCNLPIIFADITLQITPPAKPEQIGLSKVIEFIVYLRDVCHFPIKGVSFDGFQSVQGIQDLQILGFEASLLSVDKKPEPYQALRGAIMDGRLSRYAYEPLETELSLLQVEVNTQRVDHMPGGSKDVSDALAGVAYFAFEEVRTNASTMVASQAGVTIEYQRKPTSMPRTVKQATLTSQALGDYRI